MKTVAIVLLSIVVAGCIQPGPGHRPSLSDFTACPIHPGGNALACDIQMPTIETLSGLAPTWLCRASHELPDFRYSVFQSLDSMKFAVAFDRLALAGAQGVVQLAGTPQDGVFLLPPDIGEGVFAFPGNWPQAAGEFTLEFYRLDFEALAPRDQKLSASIMWTRASDGSAWPIYRVDIDEKAHYFQFYTLIRWHELTSYRPAGGIIDGADFHFKFDLSHSDSVTQGLAQFELAPQECAGR